LALISVRSSSPHELLRLDVEPKQIGGEDQYHHSAAARRSPSPTE